jgi:hypothetical protein
LFEIATLEFALPIPAEMNSERWKEAHFYGKPKHLTAARSDLPAGIEQILLRLVAKRPQDRFSTWSEVRTALATAWTLQEQSPASGGAAVERIVRAVTHARATQQQAVSRAAEEAQRAAEVVRAANYQWSQLLDEVESVLADLVRLGTATVDTTDGTLVVRVDGQAVAHARLIWLRPEYKFRNGGKANAVAMFDTVCGQGFNAVLRRDEGDDMYGRWQAVGWRRNPLFFLGQTVQHKPEPFGLDGDGLGRYMKVMEGVTSDLQAEHIGQIPARFVALLAECMEARRQR